MANILSIEERGERDEEFVRHYVSNGGNSSAAAKSIGVSDTSASTTGHRMKERLWPEIQEEIATQMQGFIPKAIQNPPLASALALLIPPPHANVPVGGHGSLPAIEHGFHTPPIRRFP